MKTDTIGRVDIFDENNGAEGVSAVTMYVFNEFGCPGEGACDEPNGTPGCNNLTCCRTVCLVDPTCCDMTWDQECADIAVDSCR